MQTQGSAKLHVAIIMDGNGRWASSRGLPRVAGHRAGLTAVRRVVERGLEIGIGRLTLYAFSSDNWRRPRAEVQSIFCLLRIFLRIETARLREHGVRLQVIGRRDRLDPAVRCEIEKAEELTAQGSRLNLCVAVDYSSRDAITRAVAELVALRSDAVPLSCELLRSSITKNLQADEGEVDLLIRTGGEKRLSDFLLWESAYAELLFTDRMWPEFNGTDLDLALQEFARRERRFGAVPQMGGALSIQCSSDPCSL